MEESGLGSGNNRASSDFCAFSFCFISIFAENCFNFDKFNGNYLLIVLV